MKIICNDCEQEAKDQLDELCIFNTDICMNCALESKICPNCGKMEMPDESFFSGYCQKCVEPAFAKQNQEYAQF